MAIGKDMRKLFKLLLFFVFMQQMAVASPWFTGPLLAPAGRTIPRGHTNFELYALSILNTGQFNESGQVVKIPLFKTALANPIFSHGLTDWMDVQFSTSYAFNSTLGKHYNRLTDSSAGIGLQLLEQKNSRIKPNLRLVIQEVFPTGKFEHLNPLLLGTDSTGLGSYQTQIAFNFQHLAQVYKNHYLRTRLSLSHLYTSSVKVHGLSSYGGSTETQGAIKPGEENDAVLAFEYTLTQNWVAVMEGYISKGNATRFNGILTIGNLGSPLPNIGSGDYYEEALTPAMEYNFSQNIGLIAGVWFPLRGKNTADYTTYVVALNAFW